MDLILELEAKFNKIENKLNSLNTKTELINKNYSNDIEAKHENSMVYLYLKKLLFFLKGRP